MQHKHAIPNPLAFAGWLHICARQFITLGCRTGSQGFFREHEGLNLYFTSRWGATKGQDLDLGESQYSQPHISTRNKFHYSGRWTGQSGCTVQKPKKCICFPIWKMKEFLQVTTPFSGVHMPSASIRVNLSEFWISILSAFWMSMEDPSPLLWLHPQLHGPLCRFSSASSPQKLITQKAPFIFKGHIKEVQASLAPLLDTIPKRKKDGWARLSFCISLRTASVTFLKAVIDSRWKVV